MKKSILIAILVFLALPVYVLALEVDFPNIGGVKPTESFGPADWIHYIFIFALAIVGLAIIYTLVYAGIEWMTAGDNSGRMSDARSRIKDAVIGLLILLGSYIILNTINPDLLTLKRNIIQVDIGKSGGVSQRKKDGQICYNNFECESGKCDTTAGNVFAAGKCAGTGSSFPLHSRVIGQECFDNSDCTSRSCYAAEGETVKKCRQ